MYVFLSLTCAPPLLPSSNKRAVQLFDQSKYFVHAPHLFNPASAPLPQLPQDGYALPSDRPILGEMDIQALSSWLGPPVSSLFLSLSPSRCRVIEADDS